MAQTTLTGSILRTELGDRYTRSGHPLHLAPVGILQPAGLLGGYQVYFNEFYDYNGAATGETDTGGWRIGETGTSAVALEASALRGALQVTTGGTDDNCTVLQQICTTWAYVAGKNLWFIAKFNVSHATLGEALIGLVPVTAAANMDTFAELLLLDNGIYFEKSDGVATMDFQTRASDVASEVAAVATMVAGTDQIFGFHVDGTGAVSVFNGTTLDNLTERGTVAAGNATIPTATLALTIGRQAGSAAAQDITVDWVGIAQEL